MKSIVILISGRGSNMIALLDAIAQWPVPVRVAGVLSNRPDATGLEVAAKRGIPTRVIDHQAFSGREAFDEAMMAVIDELSPDLVVLAGFMRILTDGFVRHFEGRLINIHPSLLPSFPGLHTHRQALEAGVRVHGCTVHFVTPDLDHGPIIVQAAMPVLPNDTEQSLAERLLSYEHKIYPLAVRWFVEERLTIENGRVIVKCNEMREPAGLVMPEWVV